MKRIGNKIAELYDAALDGRLNRNEVKAVLRGIAVDPEAVFELIEDTAAGHEDFFAIEARRIYYGATI